MIRNTLLAFFLFLLSIQIGKATPPDSITIYIFLLDECRICQEMAPFLRETYAQSKEAGYGMAGFFPNKATNREGMEKFRKKHKILFPLSLDYEKLWARQFKATILPEIILFNEDSKQIVYRGAVNDLFYAPGKRRHRVSNHYVKDAIFALQNGGSPNISETQPIGCFINYSENEIYHHEK
ncbi:MAG: redoxin domain-containing protein [Saprospiraceae bacterium]